MSAVKHAHFPSLLEMGFFLFLPFAYIDILRRALYHHICQLVTSDA